MELEKLKVALVAMNSVDNVDVNLEIIERLTIQASAEKAEAIFFPENCLYLRVKEKTAVPSFHEQMPVITALKRIARDNHILIHLGSVSFSFGGKDFNSSLIFDPHGNLRVGYSKIHLFDIQLTGQEAIRESDVFSSGIEPAIFSYKGWRFGQSICYDIRFSELYNRYYQLGVDVILIPAAFLKKTGEAHWHILNRARAIEGQCYVLSSAQGGVHSSEIYPGVTRETYGHSLCVGPWGSVELDLNEANTIGIVELKKQELLNVRTQIPMASHRKPTTLGSKVLEINI